MKGRSYMLRPFALPGIGYGVFAVEDTCGAISNPTIGGMKTMAYKIVVDREKCQGIGACVGAAPDVFEIDRDGKAIVVDPAGSDDTVIMEAAESCPLDAILLYDESGEQVYP